MSDATPRGQTLHREFVGMLFALAIAEVAVRSGEIVNSDLSALTKAPALSHLLLAAMVIATSWVGWGWSKHSLSDVRHVFTGNFVELALDVWLVGVYFFIVQGAERIVEVKGIRTIHGSLAIESLWVMVMFLTYVVWDVWTKWGDWEALVQRTWASVVCAGVTFWMFAALNDVRGGGAVVWGDAALLSTLLLFRAMKIHNLSQHTGRSWALIAALTLVCAGSAFAASQG
jgi:hypothetical protein